MAYLTYGLKSGFLTSALLMGTAPSLLAQTPANPDQLDAIYACTAITTDAERLSCFDQAVANFKTAEDSGEIVAVTKVEVEKAKKEGFGFNLPSLSGIGKIFKSDDDGKEDPFKEQIFTIERTKTFNYSRIRFYFTNGQVWEQITSDRIRVPREKDGVKPQAVIKKAAFGSYSLQINGKGTLVKVRRVK